MKDTKKKLNKKIKDTQEKKSRLIEESKNIAIMINEESYSENILNKKHQELDVIKQSLEKQQDEMNIEKMVIDRNLNNIEEDQFFQQ